MKKITITLLLLTFVLSVMGQQMNSLNLPKGLHQFAANQSINGINSQSNVTSRSTTTSVWLNYGTAIDSLTGTGALYSDYLWPDTNALFNYDSSGVVVEVAPAFVHEIGQTFYAYSDNLQEGYSYYFPTPLTTSTPYTIDSLGVGIVYSRLDTFTDTLVVYYYQAAPNSTNLPTFYYKTTNYPGDTAVFLPFMYYNPTLNEPLTNISATITAIKIPLRESDTATTSINIKGIGLTTPIDVKAGNIVAVAVTFKPGKAYSYPVNVSDSENVLSFVSWYEDPGALPYYTQGDNNNISYIIPTSVRYNMDTVGYDSLFVPEFAYGVGYAYDDHYIFYHINYTTGIQQLSSSVTSQDIYPNPASEQAVLKYTLNTSASVIITISDITGKIIRSVNEGNVGAGLNQQLINTQVLPDGVYLVSIIANGNTSVSKLVVAR